MSQKAGETFYAQGEPPSGLYAIESGYAKLYRQSRERVQILTLIGQGDCFGGESLPTGEPNSCTATALTETTAIYIPAEQLRILLEECPDLQIMFLELISARMRQFVSLVHNLAFRDVAARLAALLVERAEIEGTTTEQGVRISRLLSQQDLAAFVGTAREVIYRTFRKFEQDGLIQLSASDILILDLPRLAELALQENR